MGNTRKEKDEAAKAAAINENVSAETEAAAEQKEESNADMTSNKTEDNSKDNVCGTESNNETAEAASEAAAEKSDAEPEGTDAAQEKPEEKAEAEETSADSSDDDDEDIVFAGGDAPAAVSKSTRASHGSTSDDDDDDDEIVFAETDKRPKKSRVIKQKKSHKGIAAAVAAVLLIGAGAGVTAWMMNKNSSQVSTEISSDTTDVPADPASANISVVSKAPDSQSGGTGAKEDTPSIVDVDTTNILFGKGVTVEGIKLEGKTLTQAYDAMQDKLLELREPISISIVCDGKTMTLTQNDFDFDTNLSAVLIQAYHYSRGEISSLSVDHTTDNGITNFRVDSNINTESVDAAIKKAADFYDVPPVDAHVTKFDPTAKEKFTYADGSDGFLLDHDELTSKIKGILEQPEKKGSFSIEKHLTHFKVTLPEIKANTKLIASHRTTARNVYASNENMKLAIRAANGTIVKPGEIFSFNEMTGDSTNGNVHHYANGVEGSFVPSQAYVQGESRDEFGGGICQAATTIYNCALKANMEVIERHAHMFTVSYSPYGLDATIDYGNLDMRFKNNYDFPVYIATYVYDYNYDGLEELMVEMYGPLSTEYDEIVPVGWVTYADSKTFTAMGAKVYFKDGKEVNRVNLPRGAYELHYETYYTVINYIPYDVDYGPTAYATYETPTIYSPNGCGSNGPIPYGTAEKVLNTAKSQASKPETDKTSKPSASIVVTR